MMTSGRKTRIAHTTSARISSRPQIASVSSAVFEYPKSIARVKSCSAPSMRRAASSSSVRITPSSAPCSEPIRFCPPSPRVSDRYAVRTFRPWASQASIAVFSSSGCAATYIALPATARRSRARRRCTASRKPGSCGRAGSAEQRVSARTRTTGVRRIIGMQCPFMQSGRGRPGRAGRPATVLTTRARAARLPPSQGSCPAPESQAPRWRPRGRRATLRSCTTNPSPTSSHYPSGPRSTPWRWPRRVARRVFPPRRELVRPGAGSSLQRCPPPIGPGATRSTLSCRAGSPGPRSWSPASSPASWAARCCRSSRPARWPPRSAAGARRAVTRSASSGWRPPTTTCRRWAGRASRPASRSSPPARTAGPGGAETAAAARLSGACAGLLAAARRAGAVGARPRRARPRRALLPRPARRSATRRPAFSPRCWPGSASSSSTRARRRWPGRARPPSLRVLERLPEAWAALEAGADAMRRARLVRPAPPRRRPSCRCSGGSTGAARGSPPAAGHAPTAVVEELTAHPERFLPNAWLRPVLQDARPRHRTVSMLGGARARLPRPGAGALGAGRDRTTGVEAAAARHRGHRRRSGAWPRSSASRLPTCCTTALPRRLLPGSGVRKNLHATAVLVERRLKALEAQAAGELPALRADVEATRTRLLGGLAVARGAPRGHGDAHRGGRDDEMAQASGVPPPGRQAPGEAPLGARTAVAPRARLAASARRRHRPHRPRHAPAPLVGGRVVVSRCDVLAVGAHPDDVELGCGGTIARLAGAGHAVGLVDLTAGELGTRGDVGTRAPRGRGRRGRPRGRLAPLPRLARRAPRARRH